MFNVNHIFGRPGKRNQNLLIYCQLVGGTSGKFSTITFGPFWPVTCQVWAQPDCQELFGLSRAWHWTFLDMIMNKLTYVDVFANSSRIPATKTATVLYKKKKVVTSYCCCRSFCRFCL